MSMDELLPYYERELAFLRKGAREFGARYPKIAGRLQLSSDACDDPQIERMLEAFAALSARINKKLHDDFPEITESLLEVLYPHYLRPFPSCSIVQFDFGSAVSQLSGCSEIPRLTELSARPVKSVACRFRTVYDVTVAPIKVCGVSYQSSVLAPASARVPSCATGCITVGFESLSAQWCLSDLVKPVRVYLDGEPSFVAALRESLFLHVAAVYVESANEPGDWVRVDSDIASEVGFSEVEGLFDWPEQSIPAYRLLTEFFAFPEKFNFADLDVGKIARILGREARKVNLHFVLKDVRADSNQARLLTSLSDNSLRTGCSPVINLFKQRGEPIRVSHESTAYSVLGDARRAYAYEVYSIDSVHLVRQTPSGDSVVEFRPFYSLSHGETPSEHSHYWVAHRDENVALSSPGHEVEISIVDLDFDPSSKQIDTLSLALTCSNRALPASIAFGVSGGDLFLEGGSTVRNINFLRKPTQPCRFERGRGTQWRLISHLALNHLSLSSGGLPALKEILALYDLPRSATNARMIDGIKAVEHRAATKWLPGNPFASIVRGTEIRLTLDEDAFIGSGLDLFVRVMDHFFGLYSYANCFVQLVVLSNRSGEELVRCKPRAGAQCLV